jgi:hypothetical protein
MWMSTSKQNAGPGMDQQNWIGIQ